MASGVAKSLVSSECCFYAAQKSTTRRKGARKESLKHLLTYLENPNLQMVAISHCTDCCTGSTLEELQIWRQNLLKAKRKG